MFLPGIMKIENMQKCLNEYANNLAHGFKNYWFILPLHSKNPSKEQSGVFQPLSTLPSDRRHYRKIILATNIAENSITIPDLTYVIDFCLVRQLVTDKVTNNSSLKVFIYFRESDGYNNIVTFPATKPM